MAKTYHILNRYTIILNSFIIAHITITVLQMKRTKINFLIVATFLDTDIIYK